MNFETSFERQLSELINLIIVAQKQIEQLKTKLAGNQEFHTRLIFQRLDQRKIGQIRPQNILDSIRKEYRHINLAACQALCRKHTISGALTYQELLNLLIPKKDKGLAQRMLIRSTKRGATIQNYLWKYFLKLLNSMISMTQVTEIIRRNIQNSSQLNHLQMVEFFKICLRTPQKILNFCNRNLQGEYDFNRQDIIYISNNIRSGNPLQQMTDEDIKELICPLDFNFQKTTNEMAPYYEKLKLQKYRTQGGFFNQGVNQAMNRKADTTKFLFQTYQPLYATKTALKQNIAKGNINYNYIQLGKPKAYKQYMIPQREYGYSPRRPAQRQDHMLLEPSRVLQESKMYLDRFVKPLNYQNQRNVGIELDQYLSVKFPNEKGNYEKFDDQLPENLNSSESGSAFQRY